MKHISLLIILAMCVSHTVLSDEIDKLVSSREEQIQEVALEGFKAIDGIFTQAHVSVQVREDIIDPAWFKQRTEITDLRNVLSDSQILFSFDHHDGNPIPELLQAYLQGKIHQEMPKLFAIYKVSVEDVENFYELSHIICTLSQGRQCGRMMRAIKDEYFEPALKLKLQKIARIKLKKKLRKSQARQLREKIMLGSREQ